MVSRGPSERRVQENLQAPSNKGRKERGSKMLLTDWLLDYLAGLAAWLASQLAGLAVQRAELAD